MAEHLFHSLLQLFWPASCGQCGRPLLLDEALACRACLRKHSAAQSVLLDEGLRVNAAFSYQGPVREWIRHVKEHPAPRMLARMAEADRRPGLRGAAWLCPVPLGPAARRERGHNQAECIARSLSLSTENLVTRPLLRCTRDLRGHKSLGRKARLGLHRGYRMRRGAKELAAFAPGVWLVDDVVTTGATLAECAEVLRGAGFRVPGALVLARTPCSMDQTLPVQPSITMIRGSFEPFGKLPGSPCRNAARISS